MSAINEPSTLPTVVPEILPKEIPLRPAQTEMIQALQNRAQKFYNQVKPKMDELNAAVEEGLFFVRKDLNVPVNTEGSFYGLNNEGTAFVLIELPKPNKTAETEPAETEPATEPAETKAA